MDNQEDKEQMVGEVVAPQSSNFSDLDRSAGKNLHIERKQETFAYPAPHYGAKSKANQAIRPNFEPRQPDCAALPATGEVLPFARQKGADQVLTSSRCHDAENSKWDQKVGATVRLHYTGVHTSQVRDDASHAVPERANSLSPKTHGLPVQEPQPNKTPGHKRKRKRKSKSKSKRKRQGGWKASTGLKWRHVKLVSSLRHVASRQRMPLNWFVSIRPPNGGSDRDRKQYCSRKIGHLGQALKRRGQEHIGVTTYEKEVNGGELHAHHLLHVAVANVDVIKRLADGEIVHARKAMKTDIDYMTKHRLPLSPEFEAGTTHRRRAGAKIHGQRCSFTKAALALLVR